MNGELLPFLLLEKAENIHNLRVHFYSGEFSNLPGGDQVPNVEPLATITEIFII